MAALATGALVLGTLTLAVTSQAHAADRTDAADRPAAADGNAIPADMLTAMQRDLKLSPERAATLFAKQDAALPVAEKLERELGARNGGTWFDLASQQLVVATTDPAQVARIRATGAQVRVVKRTQEQLDGAVAKLNRLKPPAAVSQWHVDVTGNQVVVNVQPGQEASARSFVKVAGVDASAVRIVPSAERAEPLLSPVIGGDAYYPGGRCSVGISVSGGFATAGHCGKAGTKVKAADNQTALGVVKGSTYPGSDIAWVETTSDWWPRALVRTTTGMVRIAGHQVPKVGWSACRSGSTTGWRCGRVLAHNVTLTYVTGDVLHGLTKTDACAQPGDSGGSFVSGKRAIGVVSGGTVGQICNDGSNNWLSYYQPIKEILDTYDRALLVSPGTLTAMDCSSPAKGKFTCSIKHNPGFVKIKWEVGNVHRPALDGLTTVSSTCSPGFVTIVEALAEESTAGTDKETRKD
jgi:streptogrisin C